MSLLYYFVRFCAIYIFQTRPSRMGIPYRAKGINIISVAIDAPLDKINALTGSIGKLDGISAKAAYSKQN